jgi:hypothetical protein
MVLNAKHSFDNYRDLFELRSLPRLFPARRRLHTSDTDSLMVGVDTTSKFLNLFQLVTRSLDDRRSLN